MCHQLCDPQGQVYNINMLGYISIVLILHTAFSTFRWRKYIQANQEPFFLPIDIILELAVGVVLAYITIVSHTKKLKPLKQFTQAKSYDSSFHRPNFKNYRTSRASLLLPFLKQRLGTESFDLTLKL